MILDDSTSREVQRGVKFTNTEGRMAVVKGQGEGHGESVWNGSGVSVLQNEKGSGDGLQER